MVAALIYMTKGAFRALPGVANLQLPWLSWPTTFFPPYDVLRLITLPLSIKDSEYNFATYNM